jgi:hypothetical protein
MEVVEYAGAAETGTGVTVVPHPANNSAATAAAPSSTDSHLYLRSVEFTTFALCFPLENIHSNPPSYVLCKGKIFNTDPLPYSCRAEPVPSDCSIVEGDKEPPQQQLGACGTKAFPDSPIH